jgi:hypothetical protein
MILSTNSIFSTTSSYSNPPTSHLAGLSIAYETLSDTSAKLIYDISGPSNRPSFADAATVDGNETLQALLKQVSKNVGTVWMRVEVFSFMSMYAVFTSSLRPFSYLWK